MKRIINKTIAWVLAACVACAAVPAAALAVQTDASVGDMGSFAVDASGESASASTEVNVLHIEDYGVFGIVDQIHYADLSTKGGLWVGVAYGTQPYEVAWCRAKATVGADGSLSEAPAFDAGKAQYLGQSTRDSEDQAIFTWDAASDAHADGDAYYYWAVARDVAGAQSKPSDPITFVCESGYWAGPIYDTGDANSWTWSMGGEFDYGDKTYGGDGTIRKQAQLSAPALTAASDAFMALDQAAAARPARVEGAWQVSASDLAGNDDVFAGSVLMRLDVTDIVAAGAALDDLGLLWLDPYGGSVKSVEKTLFGPAVDPGTGAPYGLAAIEDAGRSYLVFFMPATLAGATGVLGAFAVTSPVSSADAFPAFARATEGGQISPAGEMTFVRGAAPQFLLYPQAEAGYAISSVEVVYAAADGTCVSRSVAPSFDGEAGSAAGTLVGNVFTMAPIGSMADEADVASYEIIAHFTQTSDLDDPDNPDNPDDPAAAFTASFSVGKTGSASSDTRVTFLSGAATLAEVAGGASATGVKVGKGAPITVRFDAIAAGYVADAVKVTFTTGEDAGKSVTYVVASDADAITLPALAADARIEVIFREGLPPLVTKTHAVSATVAAGQEACGVARASADTVPNNGSATFSAVPNAGYAVSTATVQFKDAADGAWRQGAVYTADKLAGGTSLTLTNILCDTRVEFSFITQTIVLHVQEAQHASVSIAGVQANGQGAYTVAFGDTVEVVLVADAGYQLAEGGMTLAPASGTAPIIVGATEEPTGTWRASLPYSYLVQLAGDGATLSFRMEKKPLMIDPADPETPSLPVEVGPDDEGRPIVIRPSDPSTVVDTVVVDGIEILDKDGVELKDKLTERDENGLWWHPDYPGIKYDPTTGEYILLPSGDRFTFDPVEGTIIFTQIGEGNSHTVDATFTAGVQVRISVSASADGEGAGEVIPQGLLKWKADQPLMLVAIPDEGCELASLFVNNQEVEPLEAEAQHVTQAKAAQRKAQIWSNTADLSDEGQARDADKIAQMSLVSRVGARTVDAIASIIEAVDLEVAAGTKYYEIPATLFAGRASGQPIPVYANFQKVGASVGSEEATYTVKASVRGTGGAIDGAAEQTVAAGASCTVAFKPNVGYQVAAVYVDGGARTAWSARSYTFEDVQADHTLEVEFAAIGYSGDNGAAARVARTLQALAATGDLNAPALTLLLGVAFAAGGIALLGRNRRRDEGR